MSETRALRERLEELQAELRRAKEHLEKLRAHQAREREPLQQELEAARRELAELRLRLQKAESPEGPPGTGTALPELASGGSPEGATTALVALARSPSPLEASLPALARVLKLSPVDVRFRLAPMLPAVLARLPLAQAAELRAALRAEGFLAVSCPVVPRAARSWTTVRQFELEEHSLNVEGMRGESVRVRYAELRLLMRGRRIVTQVETWHEVETHSHAGYARHRVNTTREVRNEQVENFLWALGKGARLAFTQSTHFNGLGDQLASSVFENLQRLMKELQRRAPHVVLDERLVQQPRFVLPQVDPDRGQELLAELLLQAVEEGLRS
jgi:hypothetical protein